MTYFLTTRNRVTGGGCSSSALLLDASHGDPIPLEPEDFSNLVRGRDVVLATHGFNVNQSDGITNLSAWEGLYTLPPNTIYLGILWPGDAALLRIIDYPFEADEAIQAGNLLAHYLDTYGTGASSYCLVSHSLGARMLLQAAATLVHIQPKHLVLMAGAIENDCLNEEYATVTSKVGKISVVASEEDFVLKIAYPAGNFVSGILREHLPNLKTALGLDGPVSPTPANLQGRCWQVPNNWNLGHLDYLPGDAPYPPPFAVALLKPGPTSLPPTTPSGWKYAWTAAMASTVIAAG